MKVGVRDLRNNLSNWLERVRDGDEVIVTSRGKPVAQIVPLGHKTKLQQLIEEGKVTPARRAKTPIDRSRQVRLGPGKTLSDILIEMRREEPY